MSEKSEGKASLISLKCPSFPSLPISRLDCLKNSLCIGLNIASVVGIVMANKYVFSTFNFPFGIFLTIIHFAATAFILLLSGRLGVFEEKVLPVKSVLLLSLSFCGFVVLTNLSLKYNSVAFYQMAKVLTTPLVAMVQYFVYGIGMRKAVKITLGVACIGVLMATFKEVSVAPFGTFVALTSVLVTAIYQVLVGAKQKELEANSLQLLLYQAPLSALMLVFCCPVLEDLQTIVQFDYSAGLLLVIGLSSILAAMVNVSTFLIIGRTSAITYNVVGHCKLSLVLFFGFLAFGNESGMTWFNFGGVFVALGGIVAYSYVMLKH